MRFLLLGGSSSESSSSSSFLLFLAGLFVCFFFAGALAFCGFSSNLSHVNTEPYDSL